MGRVKCPFSPKKGIQSMDILCLSNSKAPSKVKHHLLISLKVSDITELESRDDANGIGSHARFDFATSTPIMFSSH